MDLAALKQELLSGHPDAGAYSGAATDAAAELNVKNRDRPRESVSGSDVLNAIDVSEFMALTVQQRERVWDILHLGTLNPWGTEADLLIDIFGGGSDTIAALALMRVEAISRAEELGFGLVHAGHVQRARAG